MGALTPNTGQNTVRWTNPRVDFPSAIFVGDTHKGGVLPDTDGTGAVTDANLRQLEAIRLIRGKAHPLGGFVDEPLMKFQVGDFTHDTTMSAAALSAWFALWEGQRILDGNHDDNPVRNRIKTLYGSLNWGVLVGNIYFQAITENFTALNNTTPPTQALIEGEITTKLAARPADEPKILLFHRAFSGGYPAEWAAGAADALETLCNAKNVVGIIHGHDHYSQNYLWRGIPTFSPGSVAQGGLVPPYGTLYPESFLVLRMGDGWYDVAEYCFGYNVSRVWTPGVWGFAEKVTYAA